MCFITPAPRTVSAPSMRARRKQTTTRKKENAASRSTAPRSVSLWFVFFLQRQARGCDRLRSEQDSQPGDHCAHRRRQDHHYRACALLRRRHAPSRHRRCGHDGNRLRRGRKKTRHHDLQRLDRFFCGSFSFCGDKPVAATDYDLSKIRNLGIIAHIDAGKTTTTEHVLYYAGATHRLGTVDAGTTETDYDEEERKRGITIYSACIPLTWRECTINLIDTP